MHHFTITGTTGSGKTTLGRQLAAGLGLPMFDMDEWFWGPNWTQTAPELFRACAERELAAPGWVAAGNYKSIRDIVWTRAEALIWLDYRFALVFSRLFRRTLSRIYSQEPLWGNNRESWRAQFWSKDSLFLYAIKSHRSRAKQVLTDLAKPEYQHLQLIRLRSPRQTGDWLAQHINHANRI